VDAKEFDDLVAKLTSGPSRRDALKGVLGGALAAAGLSADALSKGKGGGKKGRGEGKGKKGRGKGGPGAAGRGKGKGKSGITQEAFKCSKCSQRCASGRCKRFRDNRGRRRCRCRPYGD
jgi:hypothetical protein